MRVVVWVPGGLDEVRDRLRRRVARPRALVPTANGVFLLGPAPVVAAELEDTAEVASGPGGSSVALAWDEGHVRVHVRRGDDRAVGIFEQWEALHAVAVTLGVDQDTALRAADAAAREVPYGSDGTLGADGVERWAVFLERAGFPDEGRVLRWIATTDVPAPAHRKRVWERLIGELSVFPNNPPWEKALPGQALKLAIAAFITVNAVLIQSPDPDPLRRLVIVIGLLALACSTTEATLVLSRLRRPDPFPVVHPDTP